LLGNQTKRRRVAPAARGGIPVESRIPASERTSQKLSELLTEGVADGDARAELLKLGVRNIVEEALEAEVAEVVGRGYTKPARRSDPEACVSAAGPSAARRRVRVARRPGLSALS